MSLFPALLGTAAGLAYFQVVEAGIPTDSNCQYLASVFTGPVHDAASGLDLYCAFFRAHQTPDTTVWGHSMRLATNASRLRAVSLH